MTSTVVLHVGDVRDVLAAMIERRERIDQAVTSPPFLSLRSYLPADHPDKHREIGSEPTPAAFMDTLFGLTAQLGELVPEWGSVCVELGDTMSGSGGAGGDYGTNGLRDGQQKFRQARVTPDLRPSQNGTKPYDAGGGGEVRISGGAGWPLAKSMCLMPHAYTIGLAYGHNPLTGPMRAYQLLDVIDLAVASGVPLADAYESARTIVAADLAATTFQRWRIRNVIAWSRPNPPVGSLGKRNPVTRTGDQKFRPATSYITVACRGTGRYFDLDAVRTEGASFDRPTGRGTNGSQKAGRNPDGELTTWKADLPLTTNPAGAPPLDWHTDDLDGDWLWKLATAPYRGAHYATFPLALPRRLIAAMCPARVCDVCGWPSERITAPTEEYAAARRLVAEGDAASATTRSRTVHDGGPFGSGGGAASTISNGKVSAAPTTTGWTDCGHTVTCPTCAGSGCTCPRQQCTDERHAACPTCDALGHVPAWRRGRVIDPFGGSGTTAVAAALEHRDAVLIDIDARNIALVRQRLNETVRILNERRDGDTITWTVETVTDTEHAADRAGQMDLFGEAV